MVHGLIVASLVISVYALAVYGGLVAARAKPSDRALLAGLFLAQLPMSAAAFYGVRVPLDALVRHWLGAASPLYPWVALTYAPLTEEPAKLLPLALPFVWRRVRGGDVEGAAWALGAGFGAGEAIFLATLFSPWAPDLPWYAFGAFMAERFQVALIHGLLVRASLAGLTATPRAAAGGVARAMAMHLALNLPILLARLGWFGHDRRRVAQLLMVWVAGWWVVAFARLTQRRVAR
jgi:hypothetical protein